MTILKIYYLKYKLFLWPVVTGIASLIVLSLIVIPQLLTYVSTQDTLSDNRSRLGVMEVKAEELEGIDEEALSEKLKTVFTILPKDQEVPEALLSLNSLITKAGLSIKDTSYGSAKKGEGKAEGQSSFLLTITVVGRVGSVRTLLDNLNNSPRVFKVQTIEAQFERNSQLVEVKIPVIVYYQSGSGQGVVAADQPLPKLNSSEEQLLSALTQQAALKFVPAEGTSSGVPLGKADPFE